MKKLNTFEEFLNENYIAINEAFQSPTLAAFVKQFPDKSYYARLPKGIKWDQIPEDAFIAGNSFDPDFKKTAKGDEYVIFWFNAGGKQLVKWKAPVFPRPTKYNKNPRTIDNSVYMEPGFMFVTRGSKFLSSFASKNFLQWDIATSSYDKPNQAPGSVANIYNTVNCEALAIRWDVLQQYSAEDLRSERLDQKSGALALQKISDILYQNKKRYDNAVKAGAVIRETTDMRVKVQTALELIKKKIENLTSNPFDSLLSFDEKSTRYENGSYTINKNIIVELEKLSTHYNNISSYFADYIDYAQRYISAKTNNNDRDNERNKGYLEKAEARLNEFL